MEKANMKAQGIPTEEEMSQAKDNESVDLGEPAL